MLSDRVEPKDAIMHWLEGQRCYSESPTRSSKFLVPEAGMLPQCVRPSERLGGRLACKIRRELARVQAKLAKVKGVRVPKIEKIDSEGETGMAATIAVSIRLAPLFAMLLPVALRHHVRLIVLLRLRAS